MTKSPTRESPPQASNRNRAVETFTITAVNTSSPLRGIGPRHCCIGLSNAPRGQSGPLAETSIVGRAKSSALLVLRTDHG